MIPRLDPRRAGPLLALLAAVGFSWVNVQNARAFAPMWGQDLAFFTQLVHSAAEGGPWSSPLILEPEGFLAMVHTHLVLPLVVAAYALVPRQETLLVLHSCFAALALWPALKLGEKAGLGPWAALALAALGPFQALATADFRPNVLFVPGVLGVLAASTPREALAWSLVALVGRQEASMLLVLAGGARAAMGWRDGSWRVGLAVVVFGVITLGGWLALKPNYFFHFNPVAAAAPEGPLPEGRAEALWRIGLLALPGLGSPAPLVAVLPIIREMVHSQRDWEHLVGPSAHHAAFWIPFVVGASILGAGRLGRWGGPALVLLFTLGSEHPGLREGPQELRELVERVGPEDAVVADYDTIHALAGREVLWNAAHLHQGEEERPYGWTRPWPITLEGIDVVIVPAGHPLEGRLQGFRPEARVGDHTLWRVQPK